jgi:Lrp/AsnC family transcriptional regulator, leucine-responsive regulatory protein
MDDIDRRILDLLRADARMPVSEIARSVGLSSAPVARRIERMERSGVIRGYVALVDEAQAGMLEAFTEIRLTGTVETAGLEKLVRGMPEVQQYFTIAGDPDAIVRLRVDNVDHLQRVVNAIRRTGLATGTKTMIVLSSWDRSVSLD